MVIFPRGEEYTTPTSPTCQSSVVYTFLKNVTVKLPVMYCILMVIITHFEPYESLKIQFLQVIKNSYISSSVIINQH